VFPDDRIAQAAGPPPQFASAIGEHRADIEHCLARQAG
jgi:hypothetical protein